MIVALLFGVARNAQKLKKLAGRISARLASARGQPPNVFYMGENCPLVQTVGDGGVVLAPIFAS